MTGHLSLTIRTLGKRGEGIALHNNKSVFIEGGLPGETVLVEITESHPSYYRAKIISIEKPSPNRATPACIHFGECGGCQIMHLQYQKQLELKTQTVIDIMKRANITCVRNCLPSPSSLGYRNKIQLPVRNGALGLYKIASNDLVTIESCKVHSPLGEEVFQAVRSIIQDSTISSYDPITGTGELRHLLIKTALHTQEVLITLITNQETTQTLRKLAKEILSSHPKIKGVVHNIQTEKNNVILGHQYIVLEGSGHIHERLSNLLFKVSPASFFQVNTDQAECLYAKALEYAELKGTETILDAYCGVGTLSLIFAKHVKHVVGVEYVPDAIQDATENAAINDINNVSFICAASEDYIREQTSPFDVVLLNPPRKGCERSFLEGILRLQPKKIVYISCDPSTLARDLEILQTSGYTTHEIQPFDMFPQTMHVECVALLTRE